jgi:hypothetical protein
MSLTSRALLGALLGAWCASTAIAQAANPSCDPYAPKTRAEVKADLRDWLAAGYDPLDWIDYPDNALRASRIVFQRRAQAGNTGMCAR